MALAQDEARQVMARSSKRTGPGSATQLALSFNAPPGERHTGPEVRLVSADAPDLPIKPLPISGGDLVTHAAGAEPVRPGVESQGVRDRISAEFDRLAQGSGVVSADDFLRELRTQQIVQVGRVQLRAILGRMDDLVELPGGWIASAGERGKSPLTRYLRRMLAVHHNLPVDVAMIQLKRQRAAYAALTETDLAAFVEGHRDLTRDSGRIRCRTGLGLRESNELGREERLIHEAIRDAGKPLTRDEVQHFTRHHARLLPVHLRTALAESCVLVPLGDGRYEALQPSSRLRDIVLSGKDVSPSPDR